MLRSSSVVVHLRNLRLGAKPVVWATFFPFIEGKNLETGERFFVGLSGQAETEKTVVVWWWSHNPLRLCADTVLSQTVVASNVLCIFILFFFYFEWGGWGWVRGWVIHEEVNRTSHDRGKDLQLDPLLFSVMANRFIYDLLVQVKYSTRNFSCG